MPGRIGLDFVGVMHLIGVLVVSVAGVAIAAEVVIVGVGAIARKLALRVGGVVISPRLAEAATALNSERRIIAALKLQYLAGQRYKINSCTFLFSNVCKQVA
jgi:hypothetical protein